MNQKEANLYIINRIEKRDFSIQDLNHFKKMLFQCNINIVIKIGMTTITALTFILTNNQYCYLLPREIISLIKKFDFQKEKDLLVNKNNVGIGLIDSILTKNKSYQMNLNSSQIVKILEDIKITSQNMINLILYNEKENLYLTNKEMNNLWKKLHSKEKEEVFLFFTKPQIKQQLSYEIQLFEKEIIYILYELNYQIPAKVTKDLKKYMDSKNMDGIKFQDISQKTKKNYINWILKKIEKREVMNHLQKNLSNKNKTNKNKI